MSLQHQEICNPISRRLKKSSLMAMAAQAMKMGLWLMMLGIIWTLAEQKTGAAYGLTAGLLVLSIIYYTLKIKAHDEAHYGAFELEEILRKRLSAKISQLPIGY
ncbi:MAG TPA: ABC transporter ATP-binding protein, partial [Candidatus Ignatzschineria merdigallinarum]|nr:ABC transporter ATP-binding protein [Candidatus Ignatzschineria merdigallinarum]